MSDNTPDQWEASDIVKELDEDRKSMRSRRHKPSPGICSEHTLLLESEEHNKTALIWIVRRLDLNDSKGDPKGVSGKAVAAVVAGAMALVEIMKAVIKSGTQ